MSKEIEILKRRLERERAARKQAESILESKAKELYEVNQSLESLVKNRTLQLRQSEKRYRSIVETADDIIYNIDSNGNFSFVNPAGLQNTGYTEQEIIGESFIKVIRDDYKEKVQGFYLDVLNNSKNKTYYEFPIITKMGTTLWLGQNVKIIKDEQGIASFTVLARDITKRKITESELLLAQNKLQKSELKYRSIMENMELGLLEVDNDGNIIKPYPRFCQMVGYTEEELIGKNAETTFLNSEEEIAAAKKRNETRLENKSEVYESKIRRKDGSLVDVIVSGAPFHDPYGNIIGSIGIHYDNTATKKLTAEIKEARFIAENAQKAEAEFLANMSHEMRTPLNAIIGMSHLLQDATLNPDETEYLDILSISANVLQNLISDVLDLSKIDAGKLELQHKPFDLLKLINNLERTFALKLEEKNVSIKTVTNFKQEHLLVGDELILNQILMNLLGNAEKFTSHGHIIIYLTEKESTDKHLNIELAVEDTGMGMSPSQLEKIFEQFKQASSEIRQEYGGTGLGLAITRKLIGLLDSEIKVNSQEGVGTKFYFDLSLEKTDIEIGKVQAHLDKKIEFSKVDLPVLVVEDNPMNQKYITKLLEKWRFDYHLAHNGKEGWEMTLENKYAMIFMDFQMPIMNGYESTAKIRQEGNPNFTTPIIALTASTLLSKKQNALDSGMDDFLSKPFNPKQLSEVIIKHLPNTDSTVPTETTDQDAGSLGAFQFSRKLDFTYLEENYGDDLEYYLDIIDTFLSIIPSEMELIHENSTNKSFTEVAGLLHKIKPTFTMVGAPEISKEFEHLEKSAKNNEESVFSEIKTITGKVDELISEIKKEKGIVQHFLTQNDKR